MKSEKEIVLEYVQGLKLTGVRDGLDDLCVLAAQEGWSPMRLVAELLRKETERRWELHVRTRMKAAKFPQLKYLHELDTEELPDDARKALPELETLDFVREGRNVVLYGNPGTGKTHIAVPKLLVQVREARSAKTLGILQNRFEKYDLVICDEFGYVSCDKEGGEMLFNHLSLRTGKKATIITTNLAFNRWNEIIKDKVLVAAMVDRLTHKAFLINMSGQSYRLKETQKTMNL